MADSNAVSIDEGLSRPAVSRNRVGAMTHLFPRGNLCETEALDALRLAVDEAIAAHEFQLIVDMVSVALVNSAGLECLLELRQQLIKRGGWLKVTNAKPLIRDIFRVTGLDRTIDIVNSFNIDKPESEPAVKAPPNLRMGDLLVSKGLITEARVEEAIALQKRSGQRLGQIIVAKGWVSEDVLLATLGEQLDIPYIVLRQNLIDPEVFSRLDVEVLLRLKVVPLFLVQHELSLATSDPQAIAGFREIEERLECKIRPVLVRKADIVKVLADAGSDSLYGAEMMDELDEDFEHIDNALPDDYAGIDEMGRRGVQVLLPA